MWRLQTRSIPPKRRRSSRLFEMFLLWHYGSVPLFISLPYEGYSKFITHLIFNNGSKRKIDLIFVCMYFGLKLLQFAGCGLCKLIFEIARLVAFRFCVACILYVYCKNTRQYAYSFDIPLLASHLSSKIFEYLLHSI